MARINLLPWREERRKQRQKDTGLLLGMAALAALVLSVLIVMYHNGLVSGQQARNEYLRQQTAELDKQIEEIEALDQQKARLLARKEVIEELQTNRAQMVHLFDSLVRTIPDGVVLTSVRQNENQLTLQGRAQSNARVSTYMRNLESSGWMSNPQLSIIEAREGDNALPFVFDLVVTITNPKTDPNAPTVVEEVMVVPVDPAAEPTAPVPSVEPVTPTEPTPVPPATQPTEEESAPESDAAGDQA